MKRSYYVVMQDHGRRGLEAIVDPEITRRGVIDRIASGEWRDVAFIDWVHDGCVEDVTEEILTAAGAANSFAMEEA